jgi:uncharacterized protein YndB with AHSA1/START domain
MPLREMLGAFAACLLLPLPSAAEVKLAAPDGFVVEHRFAIAASPTAAWEVLVHPERYWPDGHTWSGRAANLSLAAEAGGCFCERWAEGSAEHARVIMAVPGKLLRFRGALGPFQDMAVTGVMSVALAPGESGTEAVVTYRVNGAATQRLGEMAAAVDRVVNQQFAGFAALASRPRE